MLPRTIPKYPAKGHSLSCYKVSAFAMRNFASNFQRDTYFPLKYPRRTVELHLTLVKCPLWIYDFFSSPAFSFSVAAFCPALTGVSFCLALNTSP